MSGGIQESVFEIGQRLIDEAKKFQPTLHERTVQSLINVTLKDPKIRSRLLRFICALPQLQDSPTDLLRFSRDLFLPIVDSFPARLRPLLKLGLNRFTTPLLRLGPVFMSRQFLGGTNDQELQTIVKKLKKEKIDVTVDNLGEFVTSEEGAERYFKRAQRLITLLEKGSSVSLKVTGLTPHFDPYAPNFILDPNRPLYRRFKELMTICHERDLIAFIDAEHFQNNALMYELQRRVLDELSSYQKAGFVVQAYLRESPQYLEKIAQWAQKQRRCYVRLVKGAYHEQEVCFAQQRGSLIPVFMQQEETDTNFRKLTDQLLSLHEFITPCIAGHNVREIAYAISRAQQMGILHKLEIQCLYGMAQNLQTALVRMGVRVRAYVPHLTALDPRSPADPAEGIHYLGRRLIENGSISFQKIQITKETDPKKLLRLNDVPLENDKLARVDSLPKEYQTTLPSSGFRPTDYLNPVEPGRLEKFWGEYEKAKRAGPASGSASEDDLNRLFENTAPAQKEWSQLPVKRRTDILLKIADEIEKRRDFLASIMILESAKPIVQADADIKECLDAIRYAALDARKKEAEGFFERYEPRGIAGIISPWNFPSAIPFIGVSNALASGNAAILKPSELAPRIAIEIVEIFRTHLRNENLNPDTLQLLLTDQVIRSQRFVSDRRLEAISFTGSKKVGLEIAAAAKGRSVTTEMGGTNAFVIGIDAEVDQVVVNIRYGAFGYQGQKCSHIQNIFIPHRKFDLYVDRLREMAASCLVGPADRPETLIGPLIHERTQRHLDQILNEMPPENIIYDGQQKKVPAYPRLVGPTVILNNERLLTEEFFGPLINLIPYETHEEVLEKIRRSTYGLTFSIQTASPRIREFYLKRDLEKNTGVLAGNLYCEMPPVGAEIALNPFGGPGINLSGTGGKTGGPESMMTYLKPRAVAHELERLPTDEEWRSLARKKGNDFRFIDPTELQYPGRTDLLERTPIGDGVIVVDPEMDESTLLRLVYSYLSTGNTLSLLVHPSKFKQTENFVKKLGGYGFGSVLIRMAPMSSLGRSENLSESHLESGRFSVGKPWTEGKSSDGTARVSQDLERGDEGPFGSPRWIHLRHGFQPGDNFYAMIHDPARTERQGFVTRVSDAPPWIDDPHFLAKTQIHRVISINTLHSGDIEKVEI
ncbi:MAG: proline dehydrogenase family protein [Deltaproteobacteria bacterium]|nr:proline dehydrogenase family protein [Deltaproteobacteria bacterium]